MKRFSSFSTLFSRSIKPIGLAVLLTCLSAVTAFSQATTGSLNGTVTDPSGAVVAGATLTLVNPGTGAERTATSSTEGTFEFQTLQPGKYNISVEAKGFKKSVSRDIVISVSTSAQVTIPLEIGSA